MRPELRVGAGPRRAGQSTAGPVRGERRGYLVGRTWPGAARSRRATLEPCKFVLVGLANDAGPDGTGAFPSVATLVRCTGLSERTVRTCLDRLEAEGTVAPCAPAIVAARIKRARTGGRMAGQG